MPSSRRPQSLTLVALIAVVSAIVLANLSSTPVTVDFLNETLLKGKWAERPFGWPFSWYWRSRSAFSAPRWPGWRYNGAWLFADLAIWLAMLAATYIALESFHRKSRYEFFRRLSAITVVLLNGVAVFTMLANISVHASRGPHPWEIFSYGWPLEWCWRLHWSSTPAASYDEWGFSALALASNIGVWLLMLVATSWAAGWLTRRFRPRFAWSVRFMLIVMALAAVLCAFLSSARYRASEQDAVVAGFRPGSAGSARDWADVDGFVYAEYCGPEWLDTIGAERLRRYIVGIRVSSKYSGNEAERNVWLFNRLAQLRGLRFVDIEPDTHPRWPRENTPAMAWALGGMHQLQMINFACLGDFGASTMNGVREYMTAIGNLTRLRRLRLNIRDESAGELSRLARLRRLKTLALSIVASGDDARQGLNVGAAENSPSLLAALPVLPSLEELDVHDTLVNDEDLDRLAAFERLKSLNLAGTAITDCGLAKLSKFGSLEELAIDARFITVAGLRALVGAGHLRALHVALSQNSGGGVSIELDDGQAVGCDIAELSTINKVVDAFRASHPGIVIDSKYEEFLEEHDLEPCWYADHDAMRAFVQRCIGGR